MKEKKETPDTEAKEKEYTESAVSEPETEIEETEDPATTEELLEERVKALEAENAELKDQMLRRQAELENFRKRLIREKEEAVNFANTSLIEELLQFIDNLDRALAAAKQGGDVKAMADGVEMIQNQLLSTLEKNWGLKAIETAGCEFNPQEHEACMAVEDPAVETETVLEELQKGYKLHDRVIRPAKVKIGRPA